MYTVQRSILELQRLSGLLGIWYLVVFPFKCRISGLKDNRYPANELFAHYGVMIFYVSERFTFLENDWSDTPQISKILRSNRVCEFYSLDIASKYVYFTFFLRILIAQLWGKKIRMKKNFFFMTMEVVYFL